jgi:hypothetical protein
MNDILEKYPHATEVVRDWFIAKMEESFKDAAVPENFKDFMRQQGVPNDRLIALFKDNPRVLFDVFDDNGVIINVMYHDNIFTWDVTYTKSEVPYGVKSVDIYSSRRIAETHAVERAFQILNDKLNITLNEGQDSTTGDREIPTEE